MITSLLPSPADFRYRGSPVAPWLLGADLFMRFVTALGSIFNGHTAASVAGAVVIWRYRALIPAFTLLLALRRRE